MDKSYIKSIIAMRQAEFPTDLITRDNPLPDDSGKIITVPGVRRCGKSSKMENVVNRLLADGVSRDRILWVGFDDERLVRMESEQLASIIEAYREMYPDIPMSEVYMFFDEIQLISDWEYFVMRIYKHYTKRIFISGSNASMLSSELKSALRGWPIEEETMPLSFGEYCRFKGIDAGSWLEEDTARVRNAFLDYNTQGGFPEIALTDNPIMRVKILQGYFDTMLLKDLAEHYRVSNIEVLRYFLKRIMSNLTKPSSIRAIHGDIKSRGLKVDKNTLYEWSDYACSVFLFFKVQNFSRSLLKAETALPKYYIIDNGLRDSVLLPQSDDNGKKLENTVFLQLYRTRTPVDRIFYYQGKGECDFVVQQGIEIRQLIQVSWDISDTHTRDREISGLLEASEATGCRCMTIITYDNEETVTLPDGRIIEVVKAWKWLLGR